MATRSRSRKIDAAELRLHELAFGRVGEWVPRLFRGFEEPRHLAAHDDVLARATRDGYVRALLNAGPRHGKSTLLKAAAVRHLALRPGSWVMWASHSAELADVVSRDVRDAAMRIGLKPRRDSARLSRWELAGGGGFIAGSVGSSNLTGQGASLLIADDLYGSRELAESPTTRDAIDAWWTGTFMTRATPDASIILSGTRWHLDDQHARLVERGGWEEHNLPAISEDGAALWPAVWPIERLEAKRAELGNYDFSALYQGSPVPRGESLFVEPDVYSGDELRDAIRGGARIVVSLDPAAGLKARNDYSAAVTMAINGRGPTATALILDVMRERLELPALVARVDHLVRTFGASLAVVEGVAGFRGHAQAIRAIAGKRFRVLETQPKGDKWVRAQPLAAAIAEGRVRVPEAPRPWKRAFLDELRAFPAAAHDDMVDATAQGFALVALGLASGTSLAEQRARRARLERALPFG
ncbi:MAG TPA: phage terminase large subunit [Opitutaceae bacterium]|nr:phage terminase large subunit [Opitutaceae bacterium]